MTKSVEIEGNSAAVVSTADAANYVGLSSSTLEKLRVRGEGPMFLKLGHAVRYARPDLDEWLARHRVASTSAARA